jgi:hypothetical protein
MLDRFAFGFALLVAACGDGEASYGDPLDDPQLPPRGHADVLAWLEAKHYDSWRCEAEPHAARPGSGHSANRICSNAALVAGADDSGSFPAGSASVKELFTSSGSFRGYAVYRKMRDEAGGNSWYWYESLGDDIVANAEGDDTCTGCHGRAPRDFVYTVVR